MTDMELFRLSRPSWDDMPDEMVEGTIGYQSFQLRLAFMQFRFALIDEMGPLAKWWLKVLDRWYSR